MCGVGLKRGALQARTQQEAPAQARTGLSWSCGPQDSCKSRRCKCHWPGWQCKHLHIRQHHRQWWQHYQQSGQGGWEPGGRSNRPLPQPPPHLAATPEPTGPNQSSPPGNPLSSPELATHAGGILSTMQLSRSAADDAAVNGAESGQRVGAVSQKSPQGWPRKLRH